MSTTPQKQEISLKLMITVSHKLITKTFLQNLKDRQNRIKINTTALRKA